MEKYTYKAIENGSEMICNFFVCKNFLAGEQCDQLIDYYKSASEDKKATNIGYFDTRLIWFSAIENSHPVKDLMRQARKKTINLIKEFYEIKHDIVGDSIQLVSWPEGLGMPAHYDNRHPNKDEPHTTPWREYAGVIYLNDDFSEGELCITSANPPFLLKPEKGMLVVFGGGEGFMHGVRAAYGNTRYTMPCWFTSDVTKKERDVV